MAVTALVSSHALHVVTLTTGGKINNDFVEDGE